VVGRARARDRSPDCDLAEAGASAAGGRRHHDRLGFVIASGPDRGTVTRGADRTLRMIRFDVEAVHHAVA
jgi:hypothetical protein